MPDPICNVHRKTMLKRRLPYQKESEWWCARCEAANPNSFWYGAEIVDELERRPYVISERAWFIFWLIAFLIVYFLFGFTCGRKYALEHISMPAQEVQR